MLKSTLHKSQQGLSIVMVVSFMLMATIITTGLMHAINRQFKRQVSHAQYQSAEQAAQAGKNAAKSWLEQNGLDAVAVFQALYDNPSNPIKLPLGNYKPSPSSNSERPEFNDFEVYLTDLDHEELPYKISLNVIGRGADGSEFSYTTLFSVEGMVLDTTKLSAPGNISDFEEEYGLFLGGGFSGAVNAPFTVEGDAYAKVFDQYNANSGAHIKGNLLVGDLSVQLKADFRIDENIIIKAPLTTASGMSMDIGGSAWFQGGITELRGALNVYGNLWNSGPTPNSGSRDAGGCIFVGGDAWFNGSLNLGETGTCTNDQGTFPHTTVLGNMVVDTNVYIGKPTSTQFSGTSIVRGRLHDAGTGGHFSVDGATAKLWVSEIDDYTGGNFPVYSNNDAYFGGSSQQNIVHLDETTTGSYYMAHPVFAWYPKEWLAEYYMDTTVLVELESKFNENDVVENPIQLNASSFPDSMRVLFSKAFLNSDGSSDETCENNQCHTMNVEVMNELYKVNRLTEGWKTNGEKHPHPNPFDVPKMQFPDPTTGEERDWLVLDMTGVQASGADIATDYLQGNFIFMWRTSMSGKVSHPPTTSSSRVLHWYMDGASSGNMTIAKVSGGVSECYCSLVAGDSSHVTLKPESEITFKAGVYLLDSAKMTLESGAADGLINFEFDPTIFKSISSTGAITRPGSTDPIVPTTNVILDEAFRALSPTLKLNFKGAFKQMYDVEQQREDGVLQLLDPTKKVYLAINKDRIWIPDSYESLSWEEVVTAYNVKLFGSYDGKSGDANANGIANCSGSWQNVSDWDALRTQSIGDDVFEFELSCGTGDDSHTQSRQLIVLVGQEAGSGSSSSGTSNAGGSSSSGQEENYYTLTVNTSDTENSMIQLNGLNLTSLRVPQGSEISVEVLLGNGYEVTGWSDNAEITSTTRAFVMDADFNVTVYVEDDGSCVEMVPTVKYLKGEDMNNGYSVTTDHKGFGGQFTTPNPAWITHLWFDDLAGYPTNFGTATLTATATVASGQWNAPPVVVRLMAAKDPTYKHGDINKPANFVVWDDAIESQSHSGQPSALEFTHDNLVLWANNGYGAYTRDKGLVIAAQPGQDGLNAGAATLTNFKLSLCGGTAPESYKVNVSLSPEDGGTYTCSPTNCENVEGGEVIVTAIPAEGKVVDYWDSGMESGTVQRTFTMGIADQSTTIYFKDIDPADYYDVTVKVEDLVGSGSCEVTTNPTDLTSLYGETSVDFELNCSYTEDHSISWKVDGATVSTNTSMNHSFISTGTVEVIIDYKYYTLTLDGDENVYKFQVNDGTGDLYISKADFPIEKVYKAGTYVTVKAWVEGDNEFDSWEDGDLSGDVRTFYMDNNFSVTAKSSLGKVTCPEGEICPTLTFTYGGSEQMIEAGKVYEVNFEGADWAPNTPRGTLVCSTSSGLITITLGDNTVSQSPNFSLGFGNTISGYLISASNASCRQDW